ncbi:putative hydrolase of the alpha/beta superfamily [Labilithrix luteola]|uniref:Putative hydrolase of the alpha/beta superfamily n=1 Tax=Labilithrix luteola TaxID=1391654 RepID=A0A0K1PZ52_9BACT|nr:putative hydrolase of the alpha/beta superfamily [Labilithrix luteola]
MMRFDYGGTGDSMGDGADVTVQSCLADVALAADELRAASGASKVVAIGLRLGGTLAALATSRCALRLRHLVMWDPVFEGRAYLAELAAMHRRYMREEIGEHWEDRSPVSAEGAPSEVLGAPISAAFASELGAIDLGATELRSDHVTVVGTSGATAASAGLRERLPESPSVRWLELPHSAAWNSDAALNAAVVPMDVVQAIVTRVEEVSP